MKKNKLRELEINKKSDLNDSFSMAREWFAGRKLSDLLISLLILLGWFFGMFSLLFYVKLQDNYGDTIYYLESNMYFFSGKTTQIIFNFNPFAITSTIFISAAVIVSLYTWFDNLVKSLYLIKIFGFKIIFDNPFLNQFLIYFVIFYGIIWATICPNPFLLNSHFNLYTGNVQNSVITTGGILFVIFYSCISFYIIFISLLKIDDNQKKTILDKSTETKNILVFGITGSIGLQTVEVIKKLGHNKVNIIGASFNKNISKMKELLSEITGIKYIYSPTNSSMNNVSSYEELILKSNPDLVLNALSGIAGVEISFLSIKYKKDLALANKESLVMAGNILMKEAKKNNVRIFPVDSEHASLKAIIDKNGMNNIKNLIITCSGGPFYNKDKSELRNVLYEEAVKHPTWQMGEKISIDSATLMNKTFEIIEAYWLFNTTSIKAVYHKQSYVHAMCELNNNSLIMYTSVPSMQLAIELAIMEFNVEIPVIKEVGFNCLELTFGEIDISKWNALELSSLYLQKYSDTTFGTIITVLDEIAIKKFKNKEIEFNQIVPFILSNYENFGVEKLENFIQIKDTIKKINNFFGEI